MQQGQAAGEGLRGSCLVACLRQWDHVPQPGLRRMQRLAQLRPCQWCLYLGRRRRCGQEVSGGRLFQRISAVLRVVSGATDLGSGPPSFGLQLCVVVVRGMRLAVSGVPPRLHGRPPADFHGPTACCLTAALLPTSCPLGAPAACATTTPVCGWDGKTYANVCVARCNNIYSVRGGSCSTPISACDECGDHASCYGEQTVLLARARPAGSPWRRKKVWPCMRPPLLMHPTPSFAEHHHRHQQRPQRTLPTVTLRTEHATGLSTTTRPGGSPPR